MFRSSSFALFIYKVLLEKYLASQYYSPKGYWKGFGAIQKLAEAAKVSEDVAQQWLFKQARPKCDVPTPNTVHQADLFFLPHDMLSRGRKVYTDRCRWR